jgi:hypothetical protein
MRTNRCILTGLFLLLWLGSAAAQEASKDNFISKVEAIGQKIETQNLLDDNLKKAKEMELENQSQQLGVEKEILRKLENLRDPFQHQLPIPKDEPIKKPLPGHNEPSKEPPAINPQPIPQNPAQPVPPPLPQPGQYVLSGLIWDSDKPQAILNGKIVGIGDVIDQWTITRISRDGIQMTRQNQTFSVEPKGVYNAN